MLAPWRRRTGAGCDWCAADSAPPWQSSAGPPAVRCPDGGGGHRSRWTRRRTPRHPRRGPAARRPQAERAGPAQGRSRHGPHRTLTGREPRVCRRRGPPGHRPPTRRDTCTPGTVTLRRRHADGAVGGPGTVHTAGVTPLRHTARASVGPCGQLPRPPTRDAVTPSAGSGAVGEAGRGRLRRPRARTARCGRAAAVAARARRAARRTRSCQPSSHRMPMCGAKDDVGSPGGWRGRCRAAPGGLPNSLPEAATEPAAREPRRTPRSRDRAARGSADSWSPLVSASMCTPGPATVQVRTRGCGGALDPAPGRSGGSPQGRAARRVGQSGRARIEPTSSAVALRAGRAAFSCGFEQRSRSERAVLHQIRTQSMVSLYGPAGRGLPWPSARPSGRPRREG